MEDVKQLLSLEPEPLWAQPCCTVKARPKEAKEVKVKTVKRERRPEARREARPEARREASPEARAETPQVPWLHADREHTDGGVHLDMANCLVERLRQLQEGASKTVWILVESCRDCGSHDKSLRHDESAYRERFEKLRDLVIKRFPTVGVELLAQDDDEKKMYRIGSFEVYMCSEPRSAPSGHPHPFSTRFHSFPACFHAF